MNNILFVCTGNTCRSPMAEALLKSKNKDDVKVKSAGVFAMPGSAASVHAKEALSEKGIEHTHSAALLDKSLIEWATLILTMTNGHKQLVLENFPESTGKVFTLKEYVGEIGDVADPFGGSLHIYRKTLNELGGMVAKLLNKLM